VSIKSLKLPIITIIKACEKPRNIKKIWEKTIGQVRMSPSLAELLVRCVDA
jgi:hypothetical protein